MHCLVFLCWLFLTPMVGFAALEKEANGPVTLIDIFELGSEFDKDSICNNYSWEEEKVYVDENQVLIKNQGIYISFGDSTYKVSGIFSDPFGNYILKSQLVTIFDKCKNGHTVLCPNCEGCGKTLCPFRCKCCH